jgi:uncharacterized ferritin-like protein (DUF455 family)
MPSKSTRYLSATQAVEQLEEFAYLERACAHILAGWIVKTPLLNVKIAWGQQLAASMEQASRLRDRARGLRAGDDDEACVPRAWRDHLSAVDASEGTLEILRGICGVKQNLAAFYAAYLSCADPVADAASVEIVESARRAAQAQIKWMQKRVGALHATPLRLRRGKSTQILIDEAVWSPLDRVPRVARPPEMRRGEPGALRLLPLHPRSRKDTGIFLHNFLNEEYTTLELVARNSYEHPGMPWAFHRDAARHAGDEARHAQMFTRALPDYGVNYGDHPIYTYSYEGEYEFPATEAGQGSSRELLWRILLRQVVHEGLALDSTPFEIGKREYLKQPELARIFGYILADEVFHAGSGVKWGHYLVNGDEAEFQRERDAAYTYYAERLKDRRLTWGASHIEEAAEEAEQLEELARHHTFPFKIEVNVAARKRAGFSDEDIRRIAEDRRG